MCTVDVANGIIAGTGRAHAIVSALKTIASKHKIMSRMYEFTWHALQSTDQAL